MRDIKFRAWHKEELRMIDLNGFEIAFKGLPNNGQVTSVIEQGNLYMIDICDVELMQYTGLKDKNGVEIYEGDIIPYRNGNYAVEMCGPSWTLEGFVGSDFYGHDDPELQDWSEFEVIGNIHQNPELLEEGER